MQIPVVVMVMALVVGCGGRNLGAGDDDDGGVGNDDGGTASDAQPLVVDAEVEDPCLPMEATGAMTACDDPAPVVGWAWDGSCCVPIHCVCVGPDCDRLHPTESDCASAHVPECISPSPCAQWNYPECEDQPGCEIIYYGGGCFNLADCSPEGGDPDDWMCVERAIACVPVNQPCNDRERTACDGDCFWVQHDSELCFEQCCIDEGYGYCTSLPSCDCAPQQIEDCMDPCTSVIGYYWDGSFCQPILCCCEGPDCAETWDTAEQCWAARATCPTNACGDAQGYCMYGDYVQPACHEGFGTHWQWNEAHPGQCGMGVCCTPCPDENTPGVWYASHDPAECATIDIDCFSDPMNQFDNECGCGCVEPP
jgi:hypothetical protein